ncbi:MAG: SPOR domain-containing protein [Acidobacteriota bacterium]|nr:zinc-ribbon domain-containing protein [Blastocatellia bacterium]MDW8412886.1 SPOR domain-containing protein [Acidobacteriota bacterium]
MKIACPKCKREYRLDPTKITPKGARFTCWGCQAKVEVRPPSGDEAAATVVAATATLGTKTAERPVSLPATQASLGEKSSSVDAVADIAPTASLAAAKPAAEMLHIKCPKCSSEYRIDPAKIPTSGGKFSCRKCQARIEVRPLGSSKIAASVSPSVLSSQPPFDGETTMVMGTPPKPSLPKPPEPTSVPPPIPDTGKPIVFDPFAVDATASLPSRQEGSLNMGTDRPIIGEPASTSTSIDTSNAAAVDTFSTTAAKMEPSVPARETSVLSPSVPFSEPVSEGAEVGISELTRSASQTTKLATDVVAKASALSGVGGEQLTAASPPMGGVKTTKLDSQSIQNLLEEAKKQEKLAQPETVAPPSQPEAAEQPVPVAKPPSTENEPAQTVTRPPLTGKTGELATAKANQSQLSSQEAISEQPRIVYHSSMEEGRRQKSRARVAIYGSFLGILAAALVISLYLYYFRPPQQLSARVALTEQKQPLMTVQTGEVGPVGTGLSGPVDDKASPEGAVSDDAVSKQSVDEQPKTETPAVDQTSSDITKPVAKQSTESSPKSVANQQSTKSDIKPVNSQTQPSVTGSAQPITGGKFAVQVGASPNEAEANILRDKLQKMGFPAYVVRADLGPKGIWYRVRVGGFESDADARKVMTELKAKGIDCFLARN